MKERSGYIFERKGKWYARITLTDSNGKRREIKRTAKSKADAKQLLKALQSEIENKGEKAIDALKMTFGELCDYYETHYAKPAKFVDNQKVEGLRDLRRVKGFLIHYRAFLGKKKLREITFGDIRSYRSERLKVLTPAKRTRSIATMNRELAYLRRIFNIALRQGWIAKNPFNCGEPLILISAERKRERILTIEEERGLLEVCTASEREITYKRSGKLVTAKIDCDRSTLKALLIMLLDTGARKGETLKLAWKFVDFDNRLITFQALTTKTLRTRQVAMTGRLYNELQRLWQNSDKQPDNLVFGIADNVRKSFESACKDAGIPHGSPFGITLHSLRHSAATRLVHGQMPIQLVARVLGHSQISTAFRYTHSTDETLRQAASILEGLAAN
ncbi:MAG TPA: tyrosine-type recombinase/integrase [Pyrinomonadaceae bacterium]|jgi:integrase